MKAVIYARYSTDLQTERSIADQFALCQSYATANKLEVVETYADRARSGASVMGRDGLMRLMDAARDGAFRVVIVESLDRLSRDQEDLAGLWKRLTFLAIEIRAVHEGRADAIQIGVRGLVGALYLQDLAQKVRRGQAGVVREGRIAGGRPFGYRPVPGKPGEFVIDETEAAVVRRIFALAGEGRTAREIARTLNGEGVSPPRQAAAWNASTINGSAGRGNGILHNELYAGRIVWNRVRMIKDPDTGRRVSRPNPESEWQRANAAHLAIVSGEAFAAAQARRRGNGGEPTKLTRAPRHLLSGLLQCASCGSGMSSHGRDKTGKTRIRCSRSIESGSCGHGRLYYLEDIQKVVINGLKRELKSPEWISEYVYAYQEERLRLAAAARSDRHSLEKKLGETKRQIERLVDAIADGSTRAVAVRDRLASLEQAKTRIEELLVEQPAEAPLSLHPATVNRYVRQLETLATEVTLRGAITPGSPAAAFRDLVESVVVYPVPARSPLDIEVRGRLGKLLGLEELPPAGRYSGSMGGSGGGI